MFRVGLVILILSLNYASREHFLSCIVLYLSRQGENRVSSEFVLQLKYTRDKNVSDIFSQEFCIKTVEWFSISKYLIEFNSFLPNNSFYAMWAAYEKISSFGQAGPTLGPTMPRMMVTKHWTIQFVVIGTEFVTSSYSLKCLQNYSMLCNKSWILWCIPLGGATGGVINNFCRSKNCLKQIMQLFKKEKNLGQLSLHHPLDVP